ncbi:MAG TPA: hypothetical protein VMR98_01230, partial [Candidatus Polarisedimenticolaceae bacterium]|nr:hypothetical protein [Candidatus Polarisedimenticolaceae bacterium]
MSYQRILRYSAIAMATVGLGLGVAAADSSSIDTTGPDSSNTVSTSTNNHASLRNNNRVSVDTDNRQSGRSGSADVRHNTTGGDATSGDVSNDNLTDSS